MKKDNTGKKHIINVLWKASFTAISGRPTSAYQYGAALNMLTHTAAGTLAKDGIL
jgi:NAD(P)-dependent dehydrogenase (short-subunit alcohol dehydrogenase family)